MAGSPRNLKFDALALAGLAAGMFMLLAAAGYDPADPPAALTYPPNGRVANWCGPLGARAAAATREFLGLASFVPGLALAIAAFALLNRRAWPYWLSRGAGLLLLAVAGPALAALGNLAPEVGPVAAGGLVGLGALRLVRGATSDFAATILLAPLALAGAGLALEGFLAPVFHAFGAAGDWWQGRTWLRRAPAAAARETAAEEPEHEIPAPPVASSIPIHRVGMPAPAVRTPPPVQEALPPAPVRSLDLRINRLTDAEAPLKLPAPPALPSDFKLPGLEILDEYTPPVNTVSEAELREQANILEETFAEHKVDVKVVQVDMGPVVTQFEIALAKGLRAKRIVALGDEVGLALKAESVRFIVPIPGKSTIGIEVPNPNRSKVTMREVMAKSLAASAKMALPIYIGKDAKGQPIAADLATLPHLLIAGRTGTGKSVCLNSLILSILMTRTPDQAKFLMIDPKRVEMTQYKEVPHLMHPVVTDVKKAEALLEWAVDEMEERYALLEQLRVRDIGSFNRMDAGKRKKLAPEDPSAERAMPYIVIVVDEMADLVMQTDGKVEHYIVLLAQKARAVGIHLVLATQKPIVDVISGLIKANMPARICFQVTNRSDSRVVLDEGGAEKLLGKGDMLYCSNPGDFARAQGTFLSDEEVERVTNFLSQQMKPQFEAELLRLPAAGSDSKEDFQKAEPMYVTAVDLVVSEQRGSTSMLQSKLSIGYGKAARLIDFMTRDGIIGPHKGSQAREVLLAPEDWQRLRKQRYGANAA